MKRRDMLDLMTATIGLGWAGMISGESTGEADPRVAAVPASSADKAAADAGISRPDGAISLRTVADRMDPVRPPRAIRGNGPQWSGRGGVSAEDMGSYLHGGKRRIYVEHPERSRANAYDLGMVNRDEKGVANIPLVEKGLIETHRWVDPNGPDNRTRTVPALSPVHSVRTVADRHREGLSHRVLWQNVKMPRAGADKRTRRAEAFGELFDRDDYDIVAMCELSKPEYVETIAKEWDEPIDLDWTGRPPSDLGGCVAETSARTVSYADGLFETNPGFNKEGWQRFDIELPAERFGEGVGFEIIATHLDAFNKKRDKKIRREQLNDLVDLISDRQETRASWPKILVGDLNIHSTKDRKFCGRGVGDDEPSDVDCRRISYTYLLERMSDVGMQDAWLTHGGPARHTGAKDCKTRDDPETAICHCKDFHRMGGDRLDYVFVERPKQIHDVHLDLSRMWRTAWNIDCYTRQAMGEFRDAFVVKGNKLTDHHGIGFRLLTSPKETD